MKLVFLAFLFFLLAASGQCQSEYDTLGEYEQPNWDPSVKESILKDSAHGAIYSKEVTRSFSKRQRLRMNLMLKSMSIQAAPMKLFGEYPSEPELIPELDFRTFLNNHIITKQYDSRIELCNLDLSNPEHQVIFNNSLSIFLIVLAENLIALDEGTFVLDAQRTLGDRFGLCSKEPFSNQTSIGIGTAFLTDNDKVITSYHNFDYSKYSDYRLIAGFTLNCESKESNLIVDKNDVYLLDEFLYKNELLPFDLALIKLDREVQGRIPLKLGGLTVSSSEKIYTLGHPLGLPMKLTINADIKQVEDYYFYANLDTYQGNSGSPVFSRETHEVIGILSAGMVDFKKNGNCYESNLCVGYDCKGEKVLKLAPILNILGNFKDY